MANFTLHYVYDPLCGWCYAAAPLLSAAQAAGLPIQLHGGGLWSQATALGPQHRQHIRAHDQRIAQLSGVAFGASYSQGLLDDPSTRFWSRPVIAAVLAAGSLEKGTALAMLSAIQKAHYLEGRAVVEADVLTALATDLGVARSAFADALRRAPVDAHIHASRRFMQAHRLAGFPAWVAERDGAFTVIEHSTFYGQPQAFTAVALALLNPNLEVLP